MTSSCAAYVTYEPVLVDVVTGYRRVESGFVLRPVYHWIPTITTEQTDFDDVKVGSEFGSVETRLIQDGYYKVGFGLVDLLNASAVASLLKSAYAWNPAINVIRQALLQSTRDLLTSYPGGGAEPSRTLKQALVDDFNRIIVRGTSLYNEAAFASVTLSSETRYLLDHEAAGSDLVRLNRLLIEDVFAAIRKLPKSEQFREYFIPKIDYRIDDLDWPGKYHPEDAIWVPWLGTVGEWIAPDDMTKEAIIARQLFEQVINYGDPVPDPEMAYAQGAEGQQCGQRNSRRQDPAAAVRYDEPAAVLHGTEFPGGVRGGHHGLGRRRSCVQGVGGSHSDGADSCHSGLPGL